MHFAQPVRSTCRAGDGVFLTEHVGSTALLGIGPESATFLAGAFLENGEPGVGLGDVLADKGDNFADVFKEGQVVGAGGDDLALDGLGDVLIVFNDLFGQSLEFISDLLNLLGDLFVLGGIDLLPFLLAGLVELGDAQFFDFFLAVELGKRIGSKRRFERISGTGRLVIFEGLEEVDDPGGG